MIFTGLHYETHQPIAVTVEGETIGSVTPTREPVGDCFLIPGLFDIQVNGYAGADFNLGAWGGAGEVRFDPQAIVARLAEAGVTRLCPTVTTNSREAMRDALALLAQLCQEEAGLEEAIAGFHVEGPFISPDDGPRGAHPRSHVRLPDWDEFRAFQDAACGRIRIVTLAPELPGALSFLEKLVETGVVGAIGHSAAEPETIRDAVSAGATLSTHLGNGARATLPRHPNFLWEQLASDRLSASVIADGHHLPASTLKVFVRAKTPARIILTSDAVSLGGLPPGTYAGGRYAIESSGRVVTTGTPYLAGAGFLLDTGIAFAAHSTDLGWAGAVRCASENPAQLLGLNADLTVGNRADLARVRFGESGPLEVLKTVRAGKVIFEKPGERA
jgi:N-acetylglucosamine-6-phosphate deacetylase